MWASQHPKDYCEDQFDPHCPRLPIRLEVDHPIYYELLWCRVKIPLLVESVIFGAKKLESPTVNVVPEYLPRLSWINDVHVLMVVGMEPPNAFLPWN